MNGADTTADRVLVLGGGLAGVACAQKLGDEGIDVVVVDRNDYHQFQPLLYQVASSQLPAEDIARPHRVIGGRRRAPALAPAASAAGGHGRARFRCARSPRRGGRGWGPDRGRDDRRSGRADAGSAEHRPPRPGRKDHHR